MLLTNTEHGSVAVNIHIHITVNISDYIFVENISVSIPLNSTKIK